MSALKMSLHDEPAKEAVLPAARLGWILAAVQALIYGSFIATFIISPASMTRPLAPGLSITVAVVFGLCVVFSTIALAGLYVLIANRTATERGE
ncbi:DUF485 domain-containing protein [Rhodopseudomonas sp. HC1]|uniref:DUF485 domain-containing protein n=1 Tax=Rhodopseudomonas infernalis TaxID=2897386 RepID=UPI001EE7D5A3|nr:DUF485 domain-containing protein [Rhodopseudomonas infernalis]MCG6205603.1 DUF485 domain-containing protein [Rhodopseudomonas infernalis]